jgi:hypothetical protein
VRSSDAPLLKSVANHLSISSRDKVRIIALYIMHRDGVPEEDQRRLFQHARLSLAEQDAVKNLTRLGVRINRVSIRFDANPPSFSQYRILTLPVPSDADLCKHVAWSPLPIHQYACHHFSIHSNTPTKFLYSHRPLLHSAPNAKSGQWGS